MQKLFCYCFNELYLIFGQIHHNGHKRKRNTAKGTKVQDGELALYNNKKIAEIKNLEWNSETKVSTILLDYEFTIISNCLYVL